MGSGTFAFTLISNIAHALGKGFLDFQAITECKFTLNARATQSTNLIILLVFVLKVFRIAPDKVYD